MRRLYRTIILSVIMVFVCSCGQARRVSAQTNYVENHIDESAEVIGDSLIFPVKKNSCFILKNDIDLCGKTYILPEGVTIKGEKGVIKNGTLIGNNTRIEGALPLFDKVTIDGDWVVPEISTRMFKDLEYDNSLRDVMALTNELVNNNVKILEGVYYINLTRNQETGLYIRSNTKVVLNGEIHLRPNSFPNYHVVKLTGRNCSLSGKGVVAGDKHEHTGTTGEWGMGVTFVKAENALVSGITIKDCWGDCIYVGDESRNVTICNCVLDNGRRQGISVSSADSVWISDCIISNVSGTAPQYAIDLEPNEKQTVSNVIVKNVQAVNCVGGFEVWGTAKNAKVTKVVFDNCTVIGTSTKYPILLMTAEDVSVLGCEVESNSDYTLLAQVITTMKAHNNIFKSKGKKPLFVVQCKKEDILNNQIIIKR